MTNSQVSSTPQKPVKKKGPIRTGVVVPTLIFVVLIGVYFSFFFDMNLRHGLEYAGTHVNGAEVDIGHLRTSFIHASLEIGGIQVTDKEHPERNIIQVGSIRFEMSWDALLRGKVVVNEASILDIAALTDRKHPGRVLPPPPPPSKDKPAATDQVQKAVLQQTQKEYNGNFLGDVAGMLGSGGSTADQLKNLQGQLKSDAKIKELEKDVNEKKAKWEQRIKELPQGKELQGYSDRVKALKFDMKNPGEMAKNIQEAKKIVDEAQAKVKLIDQTQRDLKADLGNYQQAYKDLDKMIAEDVRDMQSKLKLPSIDAKEFSQQLFMGMLQKKLGGLAKYVQLARQYMPAKQTPAQQAEAKKKAEEEAIIPPKRGTGRTYHFPITTGYPLFWLKHAAISSEVTSSEFSGKLKGEIKDVTTDPAALGRPAVLILTGDFPKQDIHGLDARITLDHTTEVAKESFVIKVAHFPTKEQKLSDSSDVKLIMTKSIGTSEMEGQFVNSELSMSMKNSFSDIKYDLAAKNDIVKQIIDNVLKGIPTVMVNAEIKGSLSNLDIHINSNLGEELSKGFQKQLQAKIDEAKGQLKKLIDDKIGGNRNKLKGEIDSMTGGLTKEIDGKKGAADKATKDAQNAMTGGQKGGQKQLEDKAKDLLKGFKF